jgi:hypothetical protein
MEVTFTQRIFYIDTTGIRPEDVSNYIETSKKAFLSEENKFINKLVEEGRWEDLWIPVKSGHGTRVEFYTSGITVREE